MATVIPFKGIRPQKEKANLVASLSVTTYTKEELNKELHNNPYSFYKLFIPNIMIKKKQNLNLLND